MSKLRVKVECDADDAERHIASYPIQAVYVHLALEPLAVSRRAITCCRGVF